MIGLHFFENSLNGKFVTSFGNLIHLKSLIIMNGELEYEHIENPNRNIITRYPDEILAKLINLEELTLHHVDMSGSISENIFLMTKSIFEEHIHP